MISADPWSNHCTVCLKIIVRGGVRFVVGYTLPACAPIQRSTGRDRVTVLTLCDDYDSNVSFNVLRWNRASK